MVIPGGGHIGRQEKLEPVVRAPVGKRHRREQHDPAQVDLMALLQNSGQFRRPRRAIAFPNQKLRRTPALIARNVLIDEIGEPVCVLDNAVELSGILARGRAAVAGGNCIHKNQVCGIQE